MDNNAHERGSSGTAPADSAQPTTSSASPCNLAAASQPARPSRALSASTPARSSRTPKSNPDASSLAPPKPLQRIRVPRRHEAPALNEDGTAPRLNVRQRVRKWVQGLSSVLVAAGWGEVGAAVPDARYWNVLRTQMRLMLKQLPLIERAGIGALAGGLAGGFTNATLHPIDTVKTRLQAKGAHAYKGPWDVVRQLSASHGVAGFYRGLPAAIVGSFVSSAIYFGTYELAKGVLSRPVPLPFDPLRGRRTGEGRGVPEGGASASMRVPPLLIPPLAAALGNVASSAILVPKEVIKQRLQTGAAGSTWQVLTATLREEGVRGLYIGYNAALLRNLPTNVLNFSMFEYLKAAVLTSAAAAGTAPMLKSWQSVLCGAAAGMTSSALTTPLDVVKTRLMTEARASISKQGISGLKAEVAAKAQMAAAYTYAGVLDTLKHIYREEGLKGLTKGMEPRILYGACFSAVGFFSYEAARLFLLKAHLERKIPRKLRDEERQKEEEDQPMSPPMTSRGMGH